MRDRQELPARYIETMINKVIRKRIISEDTAQAIRTKFDWKDETGGKPAVSLKNSFRNAFNRFLERQ